MRKVVNQPGAQKPVPQPTPQSEAGPRRLRLERLEPRLAPFLSVNR